MSLLLDSFFTESPTRFIPLVTKHFIVILIIDLFWKTSFRSCVNHYGINHLITTVWRLTWYTYKISKKSLVYYEIREMSLKLMLRRARSRDSQRNRVIFHGNHFNMKWRLFLHAYNEYQYVWDLNLLLTRDSIVN